MVPIKKIKLLWFMFSWQVLPKTAMSVLVHEGKKYLTIINDESDLWNKL